MLYFFFKLDEWAILPSLIFMGVGAMTDFGPLIANPKSFLLGAAAQFGIFAAYFGAIWMGFNDKAAAAISMKALTTEKERKIKMEQLRPVSKLEKILFPIIVSVVVSLILPTTAPLIGMLMLGNLFRESGVVRQLQETASNALMYIVVILLGTSVGATTSAEAFLNATTLKIVALGLIAFMFGTQQGSFFGKVMCMHNRRQDQSSHRLGRSFRSAYGSPRIAEGRSRRGSHELPSDACHGTQCCRSYRYGSRCGNIHGSVRNSLISLILLEDKINGRKPRKSALPRPYCVTLISL